MIINILTFLVILLLIFTNGITDASNSVSSVVGTKTLSYRKACMLSGSLNFVGCISMYCINKSVMNTIVDIVDVSKDAVNVSVLLISMMVTILFSVISLFRGIPVSESYGLIFSLIGATMSISNNTITSLLKMKTIVISLLFFMLGSYLITRMVNMCIMHLISKINVKKIMMMQIVSLLGMSFAHGAQDGLKFIGLLKLYESMISPNYSSEFFAVLVCSLTLSIGTMIGGKRIIMTVGEKIVKLDNKDALVSEIATVITLLIGCVYGLPLSTSHVKTISTISIGNDGNKRKIKEIIFVWVVTLPLCSLMSFVLMKI